MKKLLLRFDESTGTWKEHKEPYITIEVETEEDFNYIKAAVAKQKPMKVVRIKPNDADCPACDAWLGNFHIGETYCHRCGQKLDWRKEQ